MIAVTREIVGVAVVSVKPISGKFSWTTHPTDERADRDAQSSLEARRMGRHTRGLFKVIVREKRESSIIRQLCGVGRVA